MPILFRATALALAMLAAATVQAADTTAELPVPAKVRALVLHGYAKASIDLVARGDLNGDGINDYALRASYPTADGNRERVLVFFGHADGSYTLAAQSQETEEAMRGTAIGDITIKRNSIFLDSGSATCCEAEGDTTQFKYRDGGFYAIGLKITLSNTTDESTPDDPDRTEDTNLLTGDQIITYIDGKKKPVHKHVQKQKLQKLEEWPN